MQNGMEFMKTKINKYEQRNKNYATTKTGKWVRLMKGYFQRKITQSFFFFYLFFLHFSWMGTQHEAAL